MVEKLGTSYKTASTIEEGIEKQAFHFGVITKHMEVGNFEEIEKDENLTIIESELKVNSQYHGYTEPLCAVCDYDNENFHVTVTTQYIARV